MNYLAHLFLSGTDSQIRLGNFLGDWFRGKQHLSLPKKIQQGVELHRFIDQFADTHPAMKASYLLLKPDLNRYAHPIVDVLQDHFLTKHFLDYSPTIDVQSYTQSCIQNLKSEAHHLPAPFPERISTMFSKVNWLAMYGTNEGMNRSFYNLAKRAKNANNIEHAWIIAQKNLPELESYFLAFFPDMIAFATEKRLNHFQLND